RDLLEHPVTATAALLGGGQVQLGVDRRAGGPLAPVGEDLRERRDEGGVPLAAAAVELGARDVELAVEQAAGVGEAGLLLAALVPHPSQLLRRLLGDAVEVVGGGDPVDAAAPGGWGGGHGLLLGRPQCRAPAPRRGGAGLTGRARSRAGWG